MKKLLVIISMLALAIGCETMYGPEQTPLTPDKTDGIAITVNSVADSTVSFTLAPVGEASYYSYLVDDSPKAVALDSSALIALQYSSVAQGTVKWSAEAPSKVVELKDLMPNTTYQIYAVAASPMGFVSSVAVTSFKTSDNEVPVLDVKKSAVADTLVTLTFSEDVVLAEGAQIIAAYYAINDPGFAQQTPVGVLPADTVYVKGNVVTAEFTSLPAGAYYAVNYAEGTIKDPTGNPAAALKSAMMLHPEGGPIGAGVYGNRELGTFTLGEIEEESFVDWTVPFVFSFDSEYGYGAADAKALGSVTYSRSGKSVTIDLVPDTDFAFIPVLDSVMLALPEPPVMGDVVTFSIEAETFEDFYGNLNEEWSAELIYSYGYTMDDIVGDYLMTYVSAFDGTTYESPLSIAAVTEEEMEDETYLEYYKGCNVKLTTLELEAKWPIYANFNFDSGVLTLSPGELFAEYKGNLMGCVLATAEGGYSTSMPVVLQMPKSGELVYGMDYLMGFLLFNPENYSPVGWYDICATFSAEKVEASAEPAPASARTFSYRPVGTKLIVK